MTSPLKEENNKMRIIMRYDPKKKSVQKDLQGYIEEVEKLKYYAESGDQSNAIASAYLDFMKGLPGIRFNKLEITLKQ